MKFPLSVLLLFSTLYLFGQHTYLESINHLIIHPNEIQDVNPSIITHFETSYSKLKYELEQELFNSKSLITSDSINKDIDLLNLCIDDWINVKSNDASAKFIDSYQEENCYELYDQGGEPILEYDIIIEKNTGTTFTHKRKVKRILTSPEWVKKVDPNCEGLEKDCLIWCNHKAPPKFQILGEESYVPCDEIPNNCLFDENNMELIYDVNLQATHKIII